MISNEDWQPQAQRLRANCTKQRWRSTRKILRPFGDSFRATTWRGNQKGLQVFLSFERAKWLHSVENNRGLQQEIRRNKCPAPKMRPTHFKPQSPKAPNPRPDRSYGPIGPGLPYRQRPKSPKRTWPSWERKTFCDLVRKKLDQTHRSVGNEGMIIFCSFLLIPKFPKTLCASRISKRWAENNEPPDQRPTYFC